MNIKEKYQAIKDVYDADVPLRFRQVQTPADLGELREAVIEIDDLEEEIARYGRDAEVESELGVLTKKASVALDRICSGHRYLFGTHNSGGSWSVDEGWT